MVTNAATLQSRRTLALLVERTAHLLEACVWVADARGKVLAGSPPDALVRQPHLLEREAAAHLLRVPLPFSMARPATLVVEMASDDPISWRLTRRLVEHLIAEVPQAADLPEPQQITNQIIYRLLCEPGGDVASILRQGQLLGIALSVPRAVLLVDAPDYILGGTGRELAMAGAEDMIQRANHVIASIVSFFHLPNDRICGYIGGGEVAVLKASSTQDLIAWADRHLRQEPPGSSWANLTALKRAGSALLARLRQDTGAAISVGVGRYHPGIAGLASSYQDARAAIRIGCRLRGINRLYCLDGLGIAAFLGVADERTKIELARHLLSPLDREPELLQTLDAWFAEDCSPSATARRLGVHRNTLRYRLDRTTLLTGFDPRRFDEAVQIRLSLMLRSFEGPLSATGDCAIAQ